MLGPSNRDNSQQRERWRCSFPLESVMGIGWKPIYKPQLRVEILNPFVSLLSNTEVQACILRVHIHKGVNLAIRDLRSSDPYVIIRMGKQKLKTRVVKKNLNPVWDEDLTLSIVEPLPVKLEVYDRDLFSADDRMGDAEFDFTPFLEAVRMRLNSDILNNTIITTVKPTRTNCLAEESYITWTDGRVVQNMVLRLRNVECGEIEIKLSWIDVPGGGNKRM
ncbi:unnamed protein product [Lactuca saligna]|uniref:C2 domain-containing protein n=1 Tax=Lactuca saligna TaxID=75948 RepID=A0AA35W1K4_LACSI|nr:unnamed protein product [Lactuca saligna]